MSEGVSSRQFSLTVGATLHSHEREGIHGVFDLLWLFSDRPTLERYTKLEHNMYNPPQYPTANTCPNDRRKTVRYLITGAVRFEWQAVDGQWYDDIGITHDIGKGGVFIESDSIPQVGSPLKLIVTLPSASKPNITLPLGGAGYVRHIRQEPSQTTGFGASAVFNVEEPMSTGNTEGGER
jgi:hypothetical protein